MSIEETIHSLIDSAAAQEAKLARLERNSEMLERALRHLNDRQMALEIWAAQVQAVLDDLEERPCPPSQEGPPGLKIRSASRESSRRAQGLPSRATPGPAGLITYRRITSTPK